MAKEYPLNQKTTSKPSNTIPLNHKFEIDRHHLPNNPGPASNKSNGKDIEETSIIWIWIGC